MKEDMLLMAHLMRRAAFGATKNELEAHLSDGYGETVESLLNVGNANSLADHMIRRYHPDHSATHDNTGAASYWLYKLVSSDEPLREKMGLFWHRIFATGYAKVTNGRPLTDQLNMFRTHGMGNFRNLLMELSKNPAMIIWLDNIDNHNGAINENYGRELLELFSLGVGNYTEEDIKECARAFTGWTVANADYTKQLAVRNSIWPYGKLDWRFEFVEDDHDDGVKTFLGETGNFDGGDIIDIICRQPATAHFLARHLYHYFVADEPPVPQWPYREPRDAEAIDIMKKAYFDSGYEIGAMLRAMFNADFFKAEDIRYAKVKSPCELVTGVLRMTGEFKQPRIEISERNNEITYMGQQLFNPPSVEGWHEGLEWIDTGSFTERINFASSRLGDNGNPGIRSIIDRVVDGQTGNLEAEHYVDKCLDELGCLETSTDTRETLMQFVEENGLPELNLPEDRELVVAGVSAVLGVVGAIPEFQRG